MRRRRLLGFVYIVPALLVAGGVILFPILYNAALSLSALNLRTGELRFIGSGNFEAVVGSPHFPAVVYQTLTWSVGSVVLQLSAGLAVALMLNSIRHGRGLLGGILLMPWVSSFVVSAAIWRWLLHPEIGGLGEPMRALGLGWLLSNWAADPARAMIALIAINTWKWFPFVAIMLLAALQAIEKELYEAAMIDGAGPVQRFRHITIPGIRLALLTTVILATTWALNGFTLVWLITGGAPAGATDIMGILVYKLGFVGFRFGQAAAASVVMFAMVVLVTLIYLRVFGREEAE
ncbi:MAG: carbohydrate ABC transporter permease [Chloroflexota bacterium]